uniref:Putative secreted protein n=1 Tax=Anopheles triannulatus TaxID=58253 RepID=A0A2M4B2U0_9DIPT
MWPGHGLQAKPATAAVCGVFWRVCVCVWSYREFSFILLVGSPPPLAKTDDTAGIVTAMQRTGNSCTST